MRIRKLYLKDIGPFDEVEFEFKPQEKGKAEIHILTGPNGSGKTTVLRSMAVFFDTSSRTYPAFEKRIHDQESSKIEFSFDKNLAAPKSVLPAIVNVADFSTPPPPFLAKFLETAKKIRSNDIKAFAYSGYHLVKAHRVNAIQQLEIDPFKDAVQFDKDIKSDADLNQWIANSISKRALERDKNNLERANKFASAMTILGRIISTLAGYEINFDLNTSPILLLVQADNVVLDFDVLPDGLRSCIRWIGDLLMRLDQINWDNNLPVNEQDIILFLDEVEVHLHPTWQRKILPVVQKLFPNAQIFLTTHSPFVVNSIDGAAIYELKVEAGKASLGEVTESKSSRSYQNVLREVFDIDEDFGQPIQLDLDSFYQYRNEILAGNESNEDKFIKLAKKLAKESIEQESVELQSIIGFELRQINRIKGKNYSV